MIFSIWQNEVIKAMEDTINQKKGELEELDENLTEFQELVRKTEEKKDFFEHLKSSYIEYQRALLALLQGQYRYVSLGVRLCLEKSLDWYLGKNMKIDKEGKISNSIYAISGDWKKDIALSIKDSCNNAVHGNHETLNKIEYSEQHFKECSKSLLDIFEVVKSLFDLKYPQPKGIDFKLDASDLPVKQADKLYQKSKDTERILKVLLGEKSILLEGARGTGKSLLFKVAKYQIENDNQDQKIRTIYKKLIIGECDVIKIIGEEIAKSVNIGQNNLRPENDPPKSPQELQNYIKKICNEHGIKRFVIFFDEAIRAFDPEKQNVFFKNLQAIQNPFITFHIAVYPESISHINTSFLKGSNAFFQTQSLRYDPLCQFDRQFFCEIQEKYFPNLKLNKVELNAIIAMANGNIRTFLQLLKRKEDISKSVLDIARDFFYDESSQIWKEYDQQSQMIISWGRSFCYKLVQEFQKGARSLFKLSDTLPKSIRYAVDMLRYTSAISLVEDGENEKIYSLNFGFILSKLEKNELETFLNKFLSQNKDNCYILKTEDDRYDIKKFDSEIKEAAKKLSLKLQKKIEELPLSEGNRKKLNNLNITTIADLLKYDDVQDFKKDAKNYNVIRIYKPEEILNQAKELAYSLLFAEELPRIK